MSARGFSLVEVLVGMAMVLGAVTAAAGGLQAAARLSHQNLRVAQADYLLTAAAEQIRLARDTNWQTTINTYTSTSTWSGIFQISTTATAVKTGEEKLVVTVAWPEGAATTTRSLSFILADLFSN